ncbi:unnamed protein product [Knipowitschia caucasica]
MEHKWDEMFLLLTENIYPEGMNKFQRDNWRKYSLKFTVKDGELFYGKRRAIKPDMRRRNYFKSFMLRPWEATLG